MQEEEAERRNGNQACHGGQAHAMAVQEQPTNGAILLAARICFTVMLCVENMFARQNTAGLRLSVFCSVVEGQRHSTSFPCPFPNHIGFKKL